MPTWKDAPDQVGRWLIVGIDQVCALIDVLPHVVGVRTASVFRYFGPIPPDPQQEQP